MTRTVADAALMLSVMAGPDDWDRTSLRGGARRLRGEARRGGQGAARGLQSDARRAARGPGSRHRRPGGGARLRDLGLRRRRGRAALAADVRADSRHVERPLRGDVRALAPRVALAHGSRVRGLHRGRVQDQRRGLHQDAGAEDRFLGCRAVVLRALRSAPHAVAVGGGLSRAEAQSRPLAGAGAAVGLDRLGLVQLPVQLHRPAGGDGAGRLHPGGPAGGAPDRGAPLRGPHRAAGLGGLRGGAPVGAASARR